ncbi:hypothetical protein [Pseudomonas sp. D1-36]|uniref:hypothetical protein n=1 Tax=unclassified Pseudomonas TaxID=196821 RepID=UPI003DA976AA
MTNRMGAGEIDKVARLFFRWLMQTAGASSPSATLEPGKAPGLGPELPYVRRIAADHYFLIAISRSKSNCATGDNVRPRRDISPKVRLIAGSISGRVLDFTERPGPDIAIGQGLVDQKAVAAALRQADVVHLGQVVPRQRFTFGQSRPRRLPEKHDQVGGAAFASDDGLVVAYRGDKPVYLTAQDETGRS